MIAFIRELLHSFSIQGLKEDGIREAGFSSFASTYLIEASESFFLKLSNPSMEEAFRGEFCGLKAIAETNTVLCPQPVAVGRFKDKSYLLVTQLKNLGGSKRGLGKLLANMHKSAKSAQFGFPCRTFCGSTELDNSQEAKSWPEWFAEHRIGNILMQIDASGALADVLPKGMRIADVIERVRNALQTLAPDVEPTLLHGDLWSGNAGSSDGVPCVYDPACYYGDSEVDLAMTQLFGGFGAAFMQDYASVLPITKQFQKKIPIYNLFHILNHALMFGGGYCTEARQMIAQI